MTYKRTYKRTYQGTYNKTSLTSWRHLAPPLVRPFLRSFIRPLVRLFLHRFVRIFIDPFVCPLFQVGTEVKNYRFTRFNPICKHCTSVGLVSAIAIGKQVEILNVKNIIKSIFKNWFFSKQGSGSFQQFFANGWVLHYRGFFLLLPH